MYLKEENLSHRFILHTKERFHEQDGDKFILDGFTYKIVIHKKIEGTRTKMPI